TAWMLVDDADGYWLTADNHALALARYRELHGWAQREQLQFARVGLDIEAPIADSQALVARGLRALPGLLWRMRSRAQVQAGRSAYTHLMELIRSDGYLVETYHLPFMADARLQKSLLLERVLGVVDVRGDRDALMLYSNLSKDRAAKALVDVYGPDAGAIAVGITGGGVEDVLVKVERRLLDYDAGHTKCAAHFATVMRCRSFHSRAAWQAASSSACAGPSSRSIRRRQLVGRCSS
ncbi:MAG TPA: hypothetical protein VMF89_12970, partial [Polyangiales bacterium]|nr:hypothetical protein [Polyangiales bacterium]